MSDPYRTNTAPPIEWQRCEECNARAQRDTALTYETWRRIKVVMRWVATALGLLAVHIFALAYTYSHMDPGFVARATYFWMGLWIVLWTSLLGTTVGYVVSALIAFAAYERRKAEEEKNAKDKQS